ncbi:hypothetical protein [Rathayibacter sp. VKM Ac-2927]|uniref:hypothetical protein n=1 Tax=Rathayibacter sp. VKM Ac-2927 TaxID=2929478 RepID=UPI001FB479A6|nr:hypothetical protein [Rathayibacter sp. VKM Ac-2927]MCJ1688567.1 hypothetical protein [Rathayibacter sp. VKM Ac-2927]
MAFVLTPILLVVLSRIAALREASFPIEALAVPILAGYTLAAGLLALGALSRSSVFTWLLSGAAVVAALSVSIMPAFTQA